MDELGEDLGPLLCCVPAEDHQLDPLRDAIAQHDRALQGWVSPHCAPLHVAAVVQVLKHMEAEETMVNHGREDTRSGSIPASNMFLKYLNASDSKIQQPFRFLRIFKEIPQCKIT